MVNGGRGYMGPLERNIAVHTANWVIICYLPPSTRTWKIHWIKVDLPKNGPSKRVPKAISGRSPTKYGFPQKSPRWTWWMYVYHHSTRKWMVGILASFRGPAHFQEWAVSLREGIYIYYLENLYHLFRQLWLVLGVKLMDISLSPIGFLKVSSSFMRPWDGWWITQKMARRTDGFEASPKNFW